MGGWRESQDLTEKNLEGFPDVFADILNAFIYEGRKVISEESLFPAPTETQYAGSGKNLRGQLEDISRYQMKDGRIVTQYLLANQSTVDAKLILRKAGYVGAVYREQYDGKIAESFPVIELVLYWGKDRWYGARSILELTKQKRLAAPAGSFVDDIGLWVYEMRRLPLKVRERFTSDMRHVVDYLAEGAGFCSERPVVHKEALVRLLRALDGDAYVDDTEEVLREMNIKEEDEITMCELFDQYTRRGRQEGLREGRQEGIMSAVRSLVKTQNWTAEQALNALGIPKEEQKQYLSAM